MTEYFLSDEAYSALADFATGRVPELSDETLDLLIDYHFVAIDVPDIEITDAPGLSGIKEIEKPPRITEYGRGFLKAMREYESRIAEFRKLSEASEKSADQASRSADASERLAALAERKASRADIKSIISLIFAGIALIFEFAVNHSAIIQFLLDHYFHKQDKCPSSCHCYQRQC